MSKEKSCGALVFSGKKDHPRLLIIRHKQGGHWSFPKGHVESGESEVQTALREVKEETGLTIRLLGDFRQQVNYSPKPGVSKDVVYFIGYADDTRTVRQEEEISELRWIDFERAREFLTYDNDRLLLNGARHFLQEYGDLFPV